MKIFYKIIKNRHLKYKETVLSKIILKVLCLCLFFIACCGYHVIAQQALSACGGNGVGPGGITNFTIGQIDFVNVTGGGLSITEGVQQTYINSNNIGGIGVVCVGDNITLTDSVSGGNWSSYNISIATIGASTGIVTGITPGVDVITYSASGYIAIKIITVNPLPNAGIITGSSAECVGSAITLNDTVSGGVWSTTNLHATISGGILSGVSAGIDTIKYAIADACGINTVYKVVTIDAAPVAGTLIGPASVCMDGTMSLSDSITGGTWNSSNGNATVSGGVVTGIASGTDTIKYSVSNSCGTAVAITVITINTLPFVSAISGAPTVCSGSSIPLTDGTVGGTWNASNTHASVSSGLISGITPGIDTIHYSVTNLCGTTTVTKIITVNTYPIVGVILGVSVLCVGSSISLTDSTVGGSWTASNSTAAISGSGAIATATGVSVGIDTIKYTVTNSCGVASITHSITINTLPVPGVITGTDTVCTGNEILLTDTTNGGLWSSSDVTIASVAGGTVIGVATGVATITYSVTNACGTATATVGITVETIPVPFITGHNYVCISGAEDTLMGTPPGGVWSVTNTNAIFTAGNILIGNNVGFDTIIYSITNFCGSDEVGISINILTFAECDSLLGFIENKPAHYDDIVVYPIPTTGNFTVELPESTLGLDATFKILDIYGKELVSKMIVNNINQKVQFNLCNVARGNYLVKVMTGAKIYRVQLVIW